MSNPLDLGHKTKEIDLQEKRMRKQEEPLKKILNVTTDNVWNSENFQTQKVSTYANEVTN